MRELDSPGGLTPSIIHFEPASQVVKFDEFKIARYKARLDRDFDEFNATKRYVIENMEYLRGRVIPMEVYSIINCPSHECVIVNDLYIYPYTEMEELIKSAKEANKKLGLEQEDDNGKN